MTRLIDAAGSSNRAGRWSCLTWTVAVLLCSPATARAQPPSDVTPTAADSATHPRLYFTADDLDGIRAKTKHPRYRDDWAELLAAADKDLDGPAIGDGWGPAALSRAAAGAARCAFVYRITGGERYGRRAREFVDALLDADDWTGSYVSSHRSGGFHLSSAALCHGLALTYDLLAEEMTDAERKRFVGVCMKKAIEPFLADCKPPGTSYSYLSGKRTMNWLSVLASGAGCLMLAIDGDGVDLSREIEIARAHMLRFIEWYDDAGCALEHGLYWAYGMGNCVQFLAALRANGWPEIFHQNARKLERTPYPNLCMCIGAKNVANFCDDSHGPLGARATVLILASEFRDARLQWWAEQMPPGATLALVFGDTELPATPPEDIPTCMALHGCGMAVLRASMTDPDTLFLGLKAGRARGKIYDDPHCQFDLNSIVLEAYGSTLIADPGYGHDWNKQTHNVRDPEHPYNATRPHNTLLVNGKGTEHGRSPLAHLQDLSPSDEIDYVVSRIERGYPPPLVRFDRHAYMVAKEFFVLLDDIELAEPAELTWNFHGAKGSCLVAGQTAKIVDGQAQLQIIPFGDATLRCARLDDHVLPRVQFDMTERPAAARAGWLLWVQRKGGSETPPQAVLEDNAISVRHGSRQWRLPIVRRRASFRSPINIIPDLAERAAR